MEPITPQGVLVGVTIGHVELFGGEVTAYSQGLVCTLPELVAGTLFEAAGPLVYGIHVVQIEPANLPEDVAGMFQVFAGA